MLNKRGTLEMKPMPPPKQKLLKKLLPLKIKVQMIVSTLNILFFKPVIYIIIHDAIHILG